MLDGLLAIIRDILALYGLYAIIEPIRARIAREK